MARRATLTEKWSDPWFMSLKPEFKLAYWYMIENADMGGVFELNEPLAELQIGMSINWQDFWVECGDRILKLKANRVWICKYIAVQQNKKKLYLKIGAHLAAVRSMVANGIPYQDWGYSLDKRWFDDPSNTQEVLADLLCVSGRVSEGFPKGPCNCNCNCNCNETAPARDDRDLQKEPGRPTTTTPRRLTSEHEFDWQPQHGTRRPQRYVIPAQYDTPDFREAFGRYLDYLYESGNGPHQAQVDANLVQMIGKGRNAEQATGDLIRSVANGTRNGRVHVGEWPERAPGAKFGAQDRSEQDSRPNVRELIAKGVI